MAPGLGLAHTDPTSYHESKKKSLHQNGDDVSATQQKSTQVPAVPVLQNDCEVEDVVEALKVCDIYIPVIINCTRKASRTDSSSLLLLG